jgi:hypothetical protein
MYWHKVSNRRPTNKNYASNLPTGVERVNPLSKEKEERNANLKLYAHTPSNS